MVSNERVNKENKSVELYIHWKGYPKSEATWEPVSHIASCKSVIKAWEKKKATERERNKSKIVNKRKHPRQDGSKSNGRRQDNRSID